MAHDLNEKTGSDVQINDSVYDRMYELAELADGIAIEFDAVDGGIYMDVDSGESFYYVEVFDIVLQNGRNHPFYDAVKNADFLRFSSKKDNIIIKFGVNGLWVRA